MRRWAVRRPGPSRWSPRPGSRRTAGRRTGCRCGRCRFAPRRSSAVRRSPGRASPPAGRIPCPAESRRPHPAPFPSGWRTRRRRSERQSARPRYWREYGGTRRGRGRNARGTCPARLRPGWQSCARGRNSTASQWWSARSSRRTCGRPSARTRWPPRRSWRRRPSSCRSFRTGAWPAPPGARYSTGWTCGPGYSAGQ